MKILLSGDRFSSNHYILAFKQYGFLITFDYHEPVDGLCLMGGGDLTKCYGGTIDGVNLDLYRDAYEYFLLKKYLSKKPVFGICRGMQVVNTYLNGSIKNITPHSNNHKDIVHTITTTNKLKHICDSFTANCNHHQAVDRIGDNLTVEGVSSDNVVEVLFGDKIILTQFHPERSSCKDLFFSLYKQMFI